MYIGEEAAQLLRVFKISTWIECQQTKIKLYSVHLLHLDAVHARGIDIELWREQWKLALNFLSRTEE